MSPDESTEIKIALARLETRLDAIEKAVSNTSPVVVQPTTPGLANAGGLVGVAAAVYVAFMQATGKA